MPRQGVRSIHGVGVHECREPVHPGLTSSAILGEFNTWHLSVRIEQDWCAWILVRRPPCVDAGGIPPKLGVVSNIGRLGDFGAWRSKFQCFLEVWHQPLPAPFRIVAEEAAPSVVVFGRPSNSHHTINCGATSY